MSIARISYTTSSKRHFYRTTNGDVAVLDFNFINPFDTSNLGGGFIIGHSIDYCSSNYTRPLTSFQEIIIAVLGLMNFAFFLLSIVSVIFAVLLIMQFQIFSIVIGILIVFIVMWVMNQLQKKEKMLFMVTFPNKNHWYLLDDDSELLPCEIDKLNQYFKMVEENKIKLKKTEENYQQMYASNDSKH
jgi:multisubunit Na+/H+ antiporter MnhE subunit